MPAAATITDFEQTVREIFALPHVIPTHQGRVAENLLFSTVLTARLRREPSAPRGVRSVRRAPLLRHFTARFEPLGRLAARPGALQFALTVITGFNTDVKHKSRVFHIQTEDKGDANPCVESLVYVGGEILATKRTSYAEVVKEGHDDHAVQDLMEQQHRTMIAAVQRGRFDGPNGSIQIPEGMLPTAPPEKKDDATAPPGAESPVPRTDRSLDQMVLEYLTSDEMPEEVELTLSPTPEFVSGRSIQTKLKATSGSPARPLVGAIVSVRILSTSARSSTVFQGKTASDGSCYVSFMVPTYPNGSAAAVIRVTSPDAGSELQYPIKRK